MKEIKRGEIYYADLRPVVGSEQGGICPVLVLQNDMGNKHSPTTIVAAITSRKTKADLPTHVSFTADCLKSKSTVLLEQIRTNDKSRLTEYLGKMDKKTMGAVGRAIVVSFGIARFARNTVDCLKFVRMLRNLGVDVYFEEQGIHSN